MILWGSNEHNLVDNYFKSESDLETMSFLLNTNGIVPESVEQASELNLLMCRQLVKTSIYYNKNLFYLAGEDLQSAPLKFGIFNPVIN